MSNSGITGQWRLFKTGFSTSSKMLTIASGCTPHWNTGRLWSLKTSLTKPSPVRFLCQHLSNRGGHSTILRWENLVYACIAALVRGFDYGGYCFNRQDLIRAWWFRNPWTWVHVRLVPAGKCRGMEGSQGQISGKGILRGLPCPANTKKPFLSASNYWMWKLPRARCWTSLRSTETYHRQNSRTLPQMPRLSSLSDQSKVGD